MTLSPRPPAGAERLLRAALTHPEWREAVLGDLAEEHRRLAVRVGAARGALVLETGRGHRLPRLGHAARARSDEPTDLPSARGR